MARIEYCDLCGKMAWNSSEFAPPLTTPIGSRVVGPHIHEKATIFVEKKEDIFSLCADCVTDWLTLWKEIRADVYREKGVPVDNQKL